MSRVFCAPIFPTSFPTPYALRCHFGRGRPRSVPIEGVLLVEIDGYHTYQFDTEGRLESVIHVAKRSSGFVVITRR